MRIQESTRSALMGVLISAVAGCNDGLTDINQDPNAPTDVAAAFLLPQAIRSTVETAFGAGMFLSHTGIWPQHIVQIQYPDEERGNVRPGRMDAYWESFYAGSLQDVQTVITKGREAGNANYEGIGLIWRSYVFHIVTDVWGDIPYTEALQGATDVTPAYDAQQDVYAGLLQDLKDGIALLDAGQPAFGSSDILYNGDVEKWRRFANSLRMRLAMRMSEVDPATARAEFTAANEAGGLQSNADNAALRWPGAPYENPLYENYLGRDDHGISGALVDSLVSLNDPRLELYAEPATEDGEYRGHYNGYIDPPLSLAFYSRIGNFWRADGAATPTLLFTYSEVLFLKAEAAVLGWIADDPGALYTAAIEANMNQYDAFSPANAPTDAEVAAYLASPRVVYNAAEGLHQIHLQKWISLYMNGSETFADWRRTGEPELTPGPDLTVIRTPSSRSTRRTCRRRSAGRAAGWIWSRRCGG